MNRPIPPRPRRALPRVEALEAKQLLTAFVVTSAADAGPGTFRQAILDANADPAADADTIAFDIPGDGVHTITPATPLPATQGVVAIDATTQPGYAGTPLVVLDGVNAVAANGSPAAGLQIGGGATGSQVRGLGIVRFGGTGLVVDAPGTTVRGVDIGTDAAGDAGLGNGGYGIDFGPGAGNSVADSLIEGNGLRAIGTDADAPGVPTPSDKYVAISDVTDSGNGARATTLQVATTGGAFSTVNMASYGTTTLTYTVTNTGSLPATDVTVALSQDIAYQTLTVTAATASQGTVDTTDRDGESGYPTFAALGTLAPGASATITVTARLDPSLYGMPGFGRLVAVASSPDLDYDAFDTAGIYKIIGPGQLPNFGPPPVVDPADTTLEVNTPDGNPDDVSWVKWGSVVTMRLTVANTGTLPANDVTLGFDQDFGKVLTVLSATTTVGTIDEAGAGLLGNKPLADIGTLAPGQVATVTITAQVADEGDPAAWAASGGDAMGDIVVATAAALNVAPQPNPGPTTAWYNYFVNETGTNPRLVSTGPTTGDGPPTGTGSVPTTGTDGGVTFPGPVFFGPGTGTDDGPTGGDVEPVAVTSDPASPTDVNPGGPNLATGTAPPPTGTLTGTSPTPPTPVAAPADLSVSAAMPTVPAVGSAGLLIYTIQNVGAGAAGDVVVRLDLGALPAGSYYAIESMGGAGGAGAVTPVAGEFNVYDVDLGPMAAGASATVAVMVDPTVAGPMGAIVAAADADAPGADPNPADNVAYAGSLVGLTATPATTTGTGHARAARVTAATRKHAATSSSTQATTTDTTAAATAGTNTVRLAATGSAATAHRVTARSVHPVPVTTTAARQASADAAATVSIARKRRSH